MTVKTLFQDIETGATFSDCRNYRFALWRIWDKQKPLLMFIGLNPSRADENKTDNTITKVSKITANLGYGGFYMMNLFAYVSTDPAKLICFDDNSLNDAFLFSIRKSCMHVVFAWGNFKVATDRAKEIIRQFPEAYCLGKNKNGSPKHPLYLLDTTQLQSFK
jgi:hypothetical protein